MLEKIKNSRRCNKDRLHSLEQQTENIIGQKFRQMADAEIDSIHKDEISVRNAVYRFVNRNQVLERERMERLLLDKSRRIRENVCYILVKRRGMDVTAYYLRRLERQASKTALLGVEETGTRREIGKIMPFLEGDGEAFRKAALTAYGRLAAETGAEIYWRFLLGDDPVLANCAYRLIRKYDVRYDAKRLYDTFVTMYPASRTGKHLFDLLVCEPTWSRLTYLLRLRFDEGISKEWRSTIIIAGGPFRSLYARISGQEAQEICDILEGNKDKISQQVREEILFGLKYVTA